MTRRTRISDSIAWKGARAAAALALAFAMVGCATVSNPNPRDPLEPFNRKVSQFNDDLDRAVLKPVAIAYREKVPGLIRTGVSNFFGNLGDAWSFVNSLLQFKLQDAEENFARFHINTFFGLGGIFDVASDLEIERHREDFGQTLGHWGAPAGPYIVLPLFGPSTLRDTLAMPVDRWGDPVQYVDPAELRYSMYGVRVVDMRAGLLRAGNLLEEAALDKYSFTRDAYLQLRRNQVYDGEPPEEAEPEGGEQPPPAPGR